MFIASVSLGAKMTSGANTSDRLICSLQLQSSNRQQYILNCVLQQSYSMSVSIPSLFLWLCDFGIHCQKFQETLELHET